MPPWPLISACYGLLGFLPPAAAVDVNKGIRTLVCFCSSNICSFFPFAWQQGSILSFPHRVFPFSFCLFGDGLISFFVLITEFEQRSGLAGLWWKMQTKHTIFRGWLARHEPCCHSAILRPNRANHFRFEVGGKEPTLTVFLVVFKIWMNTWYADQPKKGLLIFDVK